jgi:hypothetical protein
VVVSKSRHEVGGTSLETQVYLSRSTYCDAYIEAGYNEIWTSSTFEMQDHAEIG